MATLESLDKRLVGRLSWHCPLTLSLKVFKGLPLGRKVGYGLTCGLSKIIIERVYILKVFAICPTGKVAIRGTQDIISGCLHPGLLVIRLNLGILGYDDESDKFVHIVRSSGVKDGKVHFLVLGLALVHILILHLIVTLHIFRSETILLGHHRNHRLQCQLLVGSLHHTVGE